MFRAVMVSVRDTMFAGSCIGSISMYRQIVGARPTSAFLVNSFFKASRS